MLQGDQQQVPVEAEGLTTDLEKVTDLLSEERVLWGVGGSHLYNLATPSSDLDMIYVVDSPEVKVNTFHSSPKFDCHIIPVQNFARHILSDSASYPFIDFLEAPSTQWVEGKWLPYLKGLRYNGYAYLNAIRRHLKRPPTQLRLKQRIKLEMMYSRTVEEKRVRPLFTSSEREQFFERLKQGETPSLGFPPQRMGF